MSATTTSSGEAPHRALGLTDSEYALIVELMGRDPNEVELAMFSLLWSEHCAYKHSRKLLRRLPTEGPRVVMGPGENAGAVDVGNGYSIAFKVESHNHPSAVEPFQGAATGVGGILRDVFALGARPICVLDSLRFGELDSERSRYLFEHVVAGIGHYGNSIGIATVGGEVDFEAPYEQNCLVNAMCAGIARTDEMVRAAAAGVGNAVVLMGASTGRDGIGGRLGARLGRARGRRREAPDGADRRPVRGEEAHGVLPRAARAGPARLASGPRRRRAHLLRRRRWPRRGASGSTSTSTGCRCARPTWSRSRSWSPSRRSGCWRWWSRDASTRCSASASAGRPARRGSARSPTPAIRILRGGEVAGEMPVSALVDGCPLYDLEPEEPTEWIYGNEADAPASAAEPGAELLVELLGFSSIASKRWAFEQYDSIVGSRTVRRPEAADAAVLDLPEADRAIALSIDGNGRRVACDPYAGTIEAVLECAQNLACVGAEPLGLTNCLNFGNPEKPHVAWQLDRSTQGLADACRALGVPVVGGNVSLYNETESGPIYPTPVVGMVGELPDPERAGWARARDGDAIALVGPFAPSLAGSELAKRRGELGPGLPALPIEIVRPAIGLVREAVRAGAVRCAHDISDGGSPWRSPRRRSPAASVLGRPRRPGRVARLLRRDRALRRGARRIHRRRRARAIEELVDSVGAPGAFLIGDAGGESSSSPPPRPSVRAARRRRARLALARRADGCGRG